MAISGATANRIREEFPAFAYLLKVPDVAGVLAKAVEEGWDTGKLQANLYATRWWKTHSEQQRSWETTVATDIASANRMRGEKWYQVQLEAGRLGIRLSNHQVLKIGESALRYGWDEVLTRRMILQYGKKGNNYSAGLIRSQQQEIIALSKAYALPISHNTAWGWSRRLADGSMTMDGVKSELINQAGWRYAANKGLTRALQQGFTVKDYMAPVTGRVAEELGINPDSFDLTTGWGKQLVNHKDSESGEFRIMNDTEAIQWARSQTQWRDTGNARTLASQLSSAITEKMGVRKG